jgi:predicted ABC-type ATPase
MSDSDLTEGPTSPNLIVLAGPNGAGKSTLYHSKLSQKGLVFVNADLLAKDFQLDPYVAAKLAGKIRETFLEERKSFIFETVFSDPVGDKVSFMKQAVEQGWNVTLIYIGIDSPLQSKKRVATRVAAGGHDVPDEKLEGRYHRSLEN